MTKTRLLAALIMAPIAILGVLFVPTPILAALSAVVFLAALWEWLKLAEVDDTLARAIKGLPITVVAPRPIDEAISTAGGVQFAAVNEHFMLRAMPGVFCAGEMLDWEAPTGGYLLTACCATGRVAGEGALEHAKRF